MIVMKMSCRCGRSGGLTLEEEDVVSENGPLTKQAVREALKDRLQNAGSIEQLSLIPPAAPRGAIVRIKANGSSALSAFLSGLPSGDKTGEAQRVGASYVERQSSGYQVTLTINNFDKFFGHGWCQALENSSEKEQGNASVPVNEVNR